jgi:hypothetical protein
VEGICPKQGREGLVKTEHHFGDNICTGYIRRSVPLPPNMPLKSMTKFSRKANTFTMKLL